MPSIELMEDRTGEAVVVAFDPAISGYTISVNGPAGVFTTVGRTMVVPHEQELIFYHTEVNEQFGGRGLGTMLIEQALAHVRATGFAVVPVCPMVKGYLDKHGAEYERSGGEVRKPTSAHMQVLQRVLG
ncbi:N-acetyltransferase [Corynebacterium sp. 35RC1]|nr:N-acetyltransferase [Corynebacterium sp. 35RC1]